MAVGIGHDDPADLALADLDVRCPERGETVDFCSLITVGRRSEVEMQPVLPVFGVRGGPPLTEARGDGHFDRDWRLR